MLGSTESSLIQHDTSGVALSMDNTELHECESHLKKLQSKPARMSYEDDVPVGREPQAPAYGNTIVPQDRWHPARR
jgi:hypothetical protein